MKSNKVFPDSLNTAVFTTKFIVQDKKELMYLTTLKMVLGNFSVTTTFIIMKKLL